MIDGVALLVVLGKQDECLSPCLPGGIVCEAMKEGREDGATPLRLPTPSYPLSACLLSVCASYACFFCLVVCVVYILCGVAWKACVSIETWNLAFCLCLF